MMLRNLNWKNKFLMSIALFLQRQWVRALLALFLVPVARLLTRRLIIGLPPLFHYSVCSV